MMQYMVHFVRKEGEAMNPPSPEGMAEMGRIMEQAFKSGMIVSTGQLSSKSTHITLKGGEVSLSDGPFIEAKELVPGFTVIRVDTKEAAIAWATKLRRCMGDGTIRVTQLSATGVEELQRPHTAREGRP
jgi:hypothetical protein